MDFFLSSRLPSNLSYVGGCQDFMAVWLSYPSTWLALSYAKMNLQSLICLIAPEALGGRLFKTLNVSPPERAEVACDRTLFINCGLKTLLFYPFIFICKQASLFGINHLNFMTLLNAYACDLDLLCTEEN